MVAQLREQIGGETDEREARRLQGRLDRLENAAEEDLGGILDYYYALDEIRGLNVLMARYNISREELRQAGIEPPPRRNWGPDVLEVAFNLDNFVRLYEPVVAEDTRDGYREEFNDYLVRMTTRPSDEEVLQRRDQMLVELEQRSAASNERESQRIAARIERVQNADLNSIRRRMQFETLGELYGLVQKYDIPRAELREAGVWSGRRRGFRRGSRR